MTMIEARCDCPGHGGMCYRKGDRFTVYWRNGQAVITCKNPSGEPHYLIHEIGPVTRNVTDAADLFKMRDFRVVPPGEVESEEPELIPAPEGVEFAMRVFIHCDAADMSHVLNFPGNPFVPPAVGGSVEVAELIEQVGDERLKAMLLAAGTWRVMTRPEIARYKVRMVRAAHEQSRAGMMRPFREQ